MENMLEETTTFFKAHGPLFNSISRQDVIDKIDDLKEEEDGPPLFKRFFPEKSPENGIDEAGSKKLKLDESH